MNEQNCTLSKECHVVTAPNDQHLTDEFPSHYPDCLVSTLEDLITTPIGRFTSVPKRPPRLLGWVLLNHRSCHLRHRFDDSTTQRHDFSAVLKCALVDSRRNSSGGSTKTLPANGTIIHRCLYAVALTPSSQPLDPPTTRAHFETPCMHVPVHHQHYTFTKLHFFPTFFFLYRYLHFFVLSVFLRPLFECRAWYSPPPSSPGARSYRRSFPRLDRFELYRF